MDLTGQSVQGHSPIKLHQFAKSFCAGLVLTAYAGYPRLGHVHYTLTMASEKHPTHTCVHAVVQSCQSQVGI